MADTYSPYDISVDDKGNYTYLNPNTNSWDAVPTVPGVPLTDDLAKQAVAVRKQQDAQGSYGGAPTLDPETARLRSIYGTDKPGVGQIIGHNLLESGKDLGRMGATALAGIGGAAVGGPIGAAVLAAGTQYALSPKDPNTGEKDVVGPAITGILGLVGAPASSYIKGRKSITLEELNQAERGVVTAAQRALGSYLPATTSKQLVSKFSGGQIPIPAPLLQRISNMPTILSEAGIEGSVGFNPDTVKDAIANRGNVLSFEEADLLRRGIADKARQLFKTGKSANAAVAQDLKGIANSLEAQITKRFPSYSQFLDTYHKEQSIKALQGSLESPNPLRNFREMRAEGRLMTATGKIRESSVNPVANAWTEKQLNGMEDTINRIDMVDQKIAALKEGGKFTRMKGAAIGAIAGVPLGHPWLGIHLGRETSSVLAGWLTNDEMRNLLNIGIKRGVVDQPGFWVAMSAGARGAYSMATRIMNDLPSNPDIAVSENEVAKPGPNEK